MNENQGTVSWTPSELVLLHGEKFAEPAKWGRDFAVELLDGDVKVGADGLFKNLFAAAVLANEEAGAIRLVPRKVKAFLGQRETLFAEPGDGAPAWPAPSLEAEIVALVRGEPIKVEDLAHAVLRVDSPKAAVTVIEVIKEWLAERGLVTKEKTTRLRVLVAIRYRLADDAARPASEPAAAQWRERLEEMPRTRPDTWKLLVHGIEQALKTRRNASIQSGTGAGIE